MRVFIPLFLFFTGASAWGSCVCGALSDGNHFFERTVRDIEDCKSKLATESVKAFELGRVCGGKNELRLSWACVQGGDKEKTKRSVKVFKCQELSSLSGAGSLLEAVSYANILSGKEGLEPKINNGICASPALAEEKKQMRVPALVLEFDNEAETKNLLKRILPERDDAEVGEMFDLLENGSVSFFIHNDNSIMDLGEGGKSDDMGDTHGFNLVVEKSLFGGYRLKFEYESNLYTNWENPRDDHGFWRDDDGNWHVAQNYIEENLGKVILEKQKSGDAFYWSVGGGVHNINKSDGDGALGAFSALGTQAYFHETAASVSPGSARLYDNKGQAGSDTGIFAEGGLGKRHTLYRDSTKRIYIDSEARARLTAIDDASYIQSRTSANWDQAITDTTEVRFSAGHETKVYVDGSDSSNQFIDIMVGNETIQGGFLYEFKDGRAPAYQNALPENFIDRELFAAEEENMWTLYVKYKWD